MKIVIDIDNTLVDYRKSLFTYLESSDIDLIGFNSSHEMNIIKKNIKQKYGDIFWQNVQAYIYSDSSSDVFFYENSNHFIKKASKEKAEIYLVSHKTKFGMHNAKNIDIREISSQRVNNWLRNEKLFKSIKEIIFSDTFDQKIAYIKDINPTIIIDDLLDIHKKIIEHRIFDKKYINILFEGNNYKESIKNSDNIITANSWLEISEFIFK